MTENGLIWNNTNDKKWSALMAPVLKYITRNNKVKKLNEVGSF